MDKKALIVVSLASLSVPGLAQNTFPSSGNVGIGTTSPNKHIHIKDSGTGDVELKLQNSNSLNGGLIMGINGANNAIFKLKEDQHMKFFTNNLERMVLRKDGTIGMGISNPDGLLHLNATGDEAIVIGTGVMPSITFENSILFTQPNSPGVQNNGVVWYDGAGNPIAGVSGTQLQQGNEVLLFTTNNNDIMFAPDPAGASQTQMVLKPDGKLGIGTLSPTSELTVAGQIETASGVKFADGSVQTTAYDAANPLGSNANPYTQLYATEYVKVGSNSLHLGNTTPGSTPGTGDFIFTTPSGPGLSDGALRINADEGLNSGNIQDTRINPDGGKVSIGMPGAPQQTLHVGGNVLVDEESFLMFSGTGVPVGGTDNGEIVMQYNQTDQEFKVFKPASSSAGLVADVLNIGETGNIAMGAGSASGVQLLVAPNDPANSGIVVDMPVPANSFTYGVLTRTENDDTKAFGLYRPDQSTDVFTVLGNGRTFIGDVDIAGCGDCNDYMLFVRDGVRAEKVKVDVAVGTWADYVFEKDYTLMSLEQVDRFIQENGHLPNMPSAELVESEGVDVGAMQIKLLEKVEELTLHLIELERENDELREKLSELDKK